MSLTTEELRKVAKLARLKLSPEEEQHLCGQLSKILDYVHLLDQLDTENVEPMAHAADLVNVLRKDELVPSLPREQALANAPKTDGKYFLVPPILEGA